MSMLQTSASRALTVFIESFLEDIQPFRDMLEALGYIDADFNITDKGKELLKEWYEKNLKIS